MTKPRKCVFFDRDGVINRDYGYVYKQEDFVFNDGIFELFANIDTTLIILLLYKCSPFTLQMYYCCNAKGLHLKSKRTRFL